MRKDSKTIDSVSFSEIDSYHRRTTTETNYAVQGFGEVRYYTSDRFERLERDGAFYKRPNGKPLQGIGLEVETECWGISNESVLAEVFQKIIFDHFPSGLWKLQEDGSLGGESSAECITQVMTKEFIRNHYKDFKLMFDKYFPTFGISAARSGNCGMHVNLSLGIFGKTPEAQAEAVRKLYYIVNKHYDFCCKLFHRDTRRTTYCGRMDYNRAKTMTLHQHSDHYVCFNLGHYNEGRIELRLVGGQKDFPCFRNTMESVFFLCSRVCKISWADCDDLAAIFKGCNQYVFDRIKSYCADAGTISREAVEAIRGTVVRADYI